MNRQKTHTIQSKGLSLSLLHFLLLVSLIGCSRTIKHLTPEEFIAMGKKASSLDSSFTVEFIGFSRKYSYIEYRPSDEEPTIFYIKTDRLPEGLRSKIHSGVNPFPSGREE